MLYPKNIEQKIGFDKIRELLRLRCVSTLGQEYVDKIRFSDDYEIVKKLTSQTAEFQKILTIESGFPSQNFIDAKQSLKKAAIEGSFLTEEEFFEVKLSLNTIQECMLFLKNKPAEEYPYLQEITQYVSIDKDLLKSINQIIDDRGKLRDNASPELQSIRREILSQMGSLRKTLESIMKSARASGFVAEDANFTVSSGRMVIPIKAEHKRKIKGFVHDESATGQTVYLEPAEVLDLNNGIRELENKEKREIIRILTNLTTTLRPHVSILQKGYIFLGMVDFIRAKAQFALDIDAINPYFRKNTLVQWRNAKHPLLYLSHKEQKKPIVPLNITLNEDKRILVISGPNAGGKSISLKTEGLLQFMYQCGLLVPMQEGSEMGIFKSIFIDIGDEQSLENDLSTYSSHLTNMRQFANFADKDTLFLIDEFGTGTEPKLGGAIAEAILETLYETNAYGMVNTHYGNLKIFAQSKPNIANGAMRFDTDKLEPLYMLEIGQAGSSFAFEIAQKIGLPKKVLAKAKEKLGTKEINYDKLLKELENEKKALSDQNQALFVRENQMKIQLEKYTKLNTILETDKKKIINAAKLEAKILLQNTNKQIEQTIRDIRENQADKEKTKVIRQKLEKFTEENAPEILPNEENKEEDDDVLEVVGGEILVGDFVRLIGQTTIGQVLSMRGKDAEISIGELKSNIKLNRLEKISRKNAKKIKKPFAKEVSKKTGVDINEKAAYGSFSLDLRGMRGDDAVAKVESFVDNAILVGYSELRIIHGKGDGILRKLIREKLKEYKQVASMADEHADRGGAGSTIVQMK